jgi:CMP-N-acetylneuraminic acid synthetase
LESLHGEDNINLSSELETSKEVLLIDSIAISTDDEQISELANAIEEECV